VRSLEVWHADYSVEDRQIAHITYDYVRAVSVQEYGKDNPHIVIEQEGPGGVRETTSFPAHYVYKLIDRIEPEPPVSKNVVVD